MFRHFSIDPLSFWLGFIAATIIWWLINKLKQWLPDFKEILHRHLEIARQKNISGLENHLRGQILQLAQRAHLANALFALDDIVIPPQLLAAGNIIPADDASSLESICDQVIPYLAGWPELSAEYGVNKITIAQAMQEKVNLVVVGPPGYGKTIALAHLASQMARHDAAAGSLTGHFPLYLHVLDLELDINTDADPASQLLEALKPYVTASYSKSKIAGFITRLLQEGNILLLLDGLDELPAESFNRYTDYLAGLLQAYPNLRLVTTATPEYLGGLPSLGVIPMGIAAWGSRERYNLAHRWHELWSTKLFQQQDTEDAIDIRMILNWLLSESSYSSPLEWTLRVWAAYARDLSGGHPFQGIESFVERLTDSILPRPALEHLAAEMCNNQQASFTYAQAAKALARYHPQSKTGSTQEIGNEPARNSLPAILARRDRHKDKRVAAPQNAVSALVEKGIFLELTNDHLRFCHPQIAGYLAALSLPLMRGDQWPPFSSWCYHLSTLHYLSAQNKIHEDLQRVLSEENDRYFWNLAIVARWLKDVPENLEWRLAIMRRLASLAASEGLPYAMRCRFLTALLVSNDPGVAKLLRQLVTVKSAPARCLGALGIGALRDATAIGALEELAKDADASVRATAVLALGSIKTPQAFEKVIDVLLGGDEIARQAAAEALANDSEAGYAAIENSSELEDVLTRRAVVYGLARIPKEWAVALLEKMSVEDGQWVVRNAAGQALEILKQGTPYRPRPLPPPADSPWLVHFASKLGIGVAGDTPAFELLNLALKNGDLQDKISALAYFQQHPQQADLDELENLAFNEDPALSQAALHLLWLLQASREKLNIPSPIPETG